MPPTVRRVRSLGVVLLLLVVLTVAGGFDADAESQAVDPRAEQEQFLAVGRIVTDPAAGKPAGRVTVDDGTRRHDASFDRSNGAAPTERNYRFNLAAYELDKLLGLGLVAPSVERKVGNQIGALTWWLDDVLMNEQTRRRRGVEAPDRARWDEAFQLVRVFDELTANAYRSMDPKFYQSTLWDNLVITRDWQIRLIDHTRTFQTTKALADVASLVRCDRAVLVRLRGLTRRAFVASLAQYLTDDQLDALEMRRALLVTHYDSLIARLGESRVLYDWRR